jgi:hypothetical protein
MIVDTHTNGHSITIYLQQGLLASGQIDSLFYPARSYSVGKRIVTGKASIAPRIANTRAYIAALGGRVRTGGGSDMGSRLARGNLNASGWSLECQQGRHIGHWW